MFQLCLNALRHVHLITSLRCFPYYLFGKTPDKYLVSVSPELAPDPLHEIRSKLMFYQLVYVSADKSTVNERKFF